MFGNLVNYLKYNMPYRIVKNTLAAIFIVVCVSLMFGTYNKIMDEIVEQQIEINDRDIETLSGQEIEDKNNISGHTNYATDVEYKEKEETEVVEKKFVELKISIKYYVLFVIYAIILGAIVAHTCVSKFHKRSFAGTFRNVMRNIIMGCITVVIAAAVSVMFILNMTEYKKELDAENLIMIKERAKIKFEGAEVVDEKEKKEFKGTYKSIISDQCVFVAQNGGVIKINKSIIDKSGINCFNLEYAQNYGVNSAILAINKGKVDVKETDIYADSKGASGFYAKGKESQIVVEKVNMQVLGRAGAYGIVASEKGKVDVNESEIMTNGDECPVVLSKKTGGKINIKDSTLMTFGYNSPIAHVSKNVLFDNVTAGTKSSNLLFLDSGANMTLKNSNLSGGIGDAIGEKEETAILIKSDTRNYEDRKAATITFEDSSIGVNIDSKYYRKAPIFRVSNMEANINLTNTKLAYGSKIIMDLKHEANVGVTTQNGGHVKFKTDAQSLVGFIKVDEYSSLNMNMTNGSTMYGGINFNNSKSSKVELKMDTSSKLVLASNCYLTKFENEDAANSNIVFGKFKIFVNGTPIQ